MFYRYPYYPIPIYRTYPTIDITTFEKSVVAFQKTVAEANIILKKFSDPQYARRLMSAAQTGNKREVDRLIQSIGTNSKISSQYTPTGLSLKIDSQNPEIQCCELVMYLKWGN